MSNAFIGLIRIVFATSVLTALSIPTALNAVDDSQSAPTVCLDKDGQIKKGEIDVLG